MDNEKFFQNLVGIRVNGKNISTSSSKLTGEDRLVSLSDENDDIISKAIDKYVEKNGSKITIYADYRDEMDKEDIQKVLEAKDPTGTFYDIIDSYYEDYIFENGEYEYEEIVKQLDLPEEFKENAGNFDNIIEHLREAIFFEPDYNHFKTNIPVDVFVRDFEDVYDEEVLTYEEDENGEDKLVKIGKPLEWLLEKQGYSTGEFIEYYNNYEEKRGTNKFFDSLVEEADNASTYDNQLVFLGSINLGDFMDGFNSITIPDNSPCGLVNTVTGGGSTLNVALEKDINVPAKDVVIYHKDGYKYNVDDIYGLVGSAWNSEIKLQA